MLSLKFLSEEIITENIEIFMSRVHYKAEFLRQTDKEIFPKYYPDTIEQKGVWGEFKFDLDDWKPLITLRAEPTRIIVVYVDEHCVQSLTSKIRKYFDEHNTFPKDVLWIA